MSKPETALINEIVNIDAQTFPCECHPDIDTFGRRINHSSKRPKLKPLHCVMKMDGEERDGLALKDFGPQLSLG